MAETIPVLVTKAGTKGIFGEGPVVSVNVPIEKLRANLANLVANLGALVTSPVDKAGGLALKELEVGVEITAEGGVSLIGTVKASATGTLKLTFART